MSVTFCDADGVAAAAYAVVTPQGPLAFCGHHYRAHEAAFMAAGYPVEDLAEVVVPAYTRVFGIGRGPWVQLTERDHWGL